MGRSGAQARWAAQLAGWAVPAPILDAAPESPWGFPPALFRCDAHRRAHSVGPAEPSRRRALEALDQSPSGGTVLDVGVGGGAASLPLVPPATQLTGVDQSPAMLATFAAAAAEVGVAHTEVEGEWPAVAAAVGPADVVVCHHVFYNVPDLGPFAEALTIRARRRVVVELTATHPQTPLNPLWLHFWGIERPTGPTADDALALLEELGLEVGIERCRRPSRSMAVSRAEWVAFARRRLCLPAERDPEVDALLGGDVEMPSRDVVTLWWAGRA